MREYASAYALHHCKTASLNPSACMPLLSQRCIPYMLCMMDIRPVFCSSCSTSLDFSANGLASSPPCADNLR